MKKLKRQCTAISVAVVLMSGSKLQSKRPRNLNHTKFLEMTHVKTTVNRRSFFRVTAMAGGGMMISFSWLAGCKPKSEESLTLPEEWFELNSYIKIGSNGVVTLMSPNPEFGSNVKTSMPMILAEELDIDCKNVIVQQADFYPERYDRQFTGGSQGIRQGWKPLRTAGATARQMLRSE